MHKRIPVAQLELDDVTGFIQKTGKVQEPKHIPISIGYTSGGAVYGLQWEEVGIDPELAFEEKVRRYTSGEYEVADGGLFGLPERWTFHS